MNLSSPAATWSSGSKTVASPSLGVLVLGNRGMLGQDLMTRLRYAGLTVMGVDLPDIDITDPDRVGACLSTYRPTLVVNCAAYTAVDKAESEPEIAFAVNRDGAGILADACGKNGIPLIHISTDYVFDGSSRRPYRENDPVNPLGVYGRSKWEGEEAIRCHLDQHLIVRTAWLFGANGPNFVKTMLRLAGEREELRVVADQHGCPTWTVHLADGLAKIVVRILRNRDGIPWGTYHLCGEGETTWHQFAQEIIREGRKWLALKVRQIIPIETEDYPTPARRPAWSVLDCSKIGSAFGILPGPWQVGLTEMLEEVFASRSGVE